MSKFVNINAITLNVDDIRRVEFLGDDIYLGLLPKGKNGEFICDYITFEYANIYTFEGKKFTLSFDLYIPEDETEDEWIAKNRAYINMSMEALNKALKPIELTGMEYM